MFHSIVGSKFHIHFAEQDAMACESVQRPKTRDEIERILEQLSGKKFDLVTAVSNDVTPPVRTFMEPEEDIAPAAPEPVAPPPPPPPVEKKAAAKAAAEAVDPLEEEFRKDPFIREALDQFEGKIAP